MIVTSRHLYSPIYFGQAEQDARRARSSGDCRIFTFPEYLLGYLGHRFNTILRHILRLLLIFSITLIDGRRVPRMCAELRGCLVMGMLVLRCAWPLACRTGDPMAVEISTRSWITVRLPLAAPDCLSSTSKDLSNL